MEMVRNPRAEWGLDCYVTMITAGLGVASTRKHIEITSPATAYIELSDAFPLFPNRASALMWDETHGWAAAIESASGRDWVMVAYLGMDILPGPNVVVDFARRLLHGNHADGPFPPELGTGNDLSNRLAAYAP